MSPALERFLWDARLKAARSLPRWLAEVLGLYPASRAVPRAVWRWGRGRPLTHADQAERCAGPTAIGSVVARARLWSDHVRSVVACPLADDERVTALAGAC